jgi:PIN domain nuclease of toxin-antitoxin system
MKFLLDTHAFLWFVDESPQLAAHARKLIEDGNNEVQVSIASLWEMAIKVSLSRLQLPAALEPFVTQQLAANDFSLLPIEVSHLGLVASLPFHHRDPFDRLLAAQSLVENIPVISADSRLDSYGIQ